MPIPRQHCLHSGVASVDIGSVEDQAAVIAFVRVVVNASNCSPAHCLEADLNMNATGRCV